MKITIEAVADAPVPYKPGDRVTCTEHEGFYRGRVGMVFHSGPIVTGVKWDPRDRFDEFEDQSFKLNVYLVRLE